MGKASGNDKKAYQLYLAVEARDNAALEKLTTEANNNEDIYSALQLGYIQQKGIGNAAINCTGALRAYEIAKDLPAANWNAGLIYLQGCPAGKPDMAKAVAKFSAAAGVNEKGMVQPMLMLGMIYEQGTDVVPRNEVLSAQWFDKAAANADPVGQYKSGMNSLTGNGRPLNIQSGISTLTLAAKQWNRDAQFALGKLFAEGREGLLQPNKVLAAQWLIIAGTGSATHQRIANNYLNTLSELEAKQAREVARIWMNAHQQFPARIDYNAPINKE